jgi:hypothetical protein
MMGDGADQTIFVLVGSRPATSAQFVKSTAAQGSQIQYPFRSMMKFTGINELIGMPPVRHAVQLHIFIYDYCQRFFGRDGLVLLNRMNVNLMNRQISLQNPHHMLIWPLTILGGQSFLSNKICGYWAPVPLNEDLPQLDSR